MDETLFKYASVEVTEVNEGQREIVAIVNTDAVDQDQEVILPSGLIKKNYAETPVYWDHEYLRNPKALPIGKTLWVKENGGRIIAKARFSKTSDFAQTIFGLIQDGTVSGFSVGAGFNKADASAPTAEEIAKNPKWAKAKNMIRRWHMTEFSPTPNPCNEEARLLMVSKAKGMGASDDTLALLQGKEGSVQPLVEVKSAVIVPSIVDARIALYQAVINRLRK